MPDSVMASSVKIVTVVGARPHFIKMAPVSEALRGACDEVVIHTGQHYDDGLSEVFFREMRIAKPAYHLAAGSGTHGAQTSRILDGVERVLLAEKPDGVLLYGDTNSTLAGALAAVKLQLPLAHVESGPRVGSRRNPEEVNRIVADHVSDILFAPTADSMAHLRREGLSERSHLVGDVMLDTFLLYRNALRLDDFLRGQGLARGPYWLATLHRQENTDDASRLERILEALEATGHTFLLPLHPRTRDSLARHPHLASRRWTNLRFLPPLGYPAMASLLGGAAGVVTDSGGVQKEAYWARVPCVTMLPFTPWVETIKEGWNTLVDADPVRIRQAVANAHKGTGDGQAFGKPGASALIADILRSAWGGRA